MGAGAATNPKPATGLTASAPSPPDTIRAPNRGVLDGAAMAGIILIRGARLAALQPACHAARILPVAGVTARLLQRLRALEGHAFEHMVKNATEQASRMGAGDFALTDRIGGYWNRARAAPGTIEIDLVAWNEDNRRVCFGSCKRSADGHDAAALRAFRDDVDRFLSTRTGRRFRDWHREFVLHSPRFAVEKRGVLEEDGWLCRDPTDFRRMLGQQENGVRDAPT